MARFTLKNGKLMPTDEASKKPHAGSAKRQAKLARLGSTTDSGAPVSVATARQATKGGKK